MDYWMYPMNSLIDSFRNQKIVFNSIADVIIANYTKKQLKDIQIVNQAIMQQMYYRSICNNSCLENGKTFSKQLAE